MIRVHPLLIMIGAAALLLHTRAAFAKEVEPVRFELNAPAGCVDDEDALRGDIAELGGIFRDANLDDRARRFRIDVTTTTTPTDNKQRVTGRLVVSDLAFRETVRETHASTCAEVASALALFVATALDERPDTAAQAPAPITPPPAPWPEAGGTFGDSYERVKVRRRGSGGIVASTFASGLVSETESEGIRLHGVVRAFGTTRLGLAVAVAKERRHRSTDRSIDDSTGTSTRLGGVIGWGAPWNDSVVGFVLEGGVSWGEHRGTSLLYPPTAWSSRSFALMLDGTYQRVDKSWSTLSPYVAWQLVWQVPWKSKVRPVASFGGLWVPKTTGNNGSPAATAELGVVWQAW